MSRLTAARSYHFVSWPCFESRSTAVIEHGVGVYTDEVTAPRLHVICGLPGAGKTTRAKEISTATGAIRLCPDEWLEAMHISLLDYETRFRLEPHMRKHAEELLRAGVSVSVEFGAWSRSEREIIRQIAVRTGAGTELHFLDAPIDELARRVTERGGPHAAGLVDDVLLKFAGKFERPTPEEAALYDRYTGPP
jgi:predicted kinase